MTDWIGVYALGCTGWCLGGLWLRWASLHEVRRNRWISANTSPISAPPPQSLLTACRATFTRPWASFHRRSDRIWALGYVSYHAAIALVITGYVASLFSLSLDALRGRVIPDYFTHAPNLTNNSVGNLMAWVFGNADTSASEFLFGRGAIAFRTMAWIELPLAMAGNACLLAVVLSARVGAIQRGIDPVSARVRHAGRFSAQHLIVRLIILSIICLEFIGRFDGYQCAASLHTIMAFTLVGLVPMTYLTHIPLAPFALWQALTRRRLNRVV